MRILTALTYYRPHFSGLTIYAERLACALGEHGHSVTVLTSRYEPDLPAQEQRDGVQVVRLPVGLRVSKGVVMPSMFFKAWGMIRQADIVHLHLPQLDAFYLALIARLFRKPVVLTYHCDLRLPEGIVHRLANSVSTMANHVAAMAANVIVTNTRDYAESSGYLRHYLRKVRPTYPPVEVVPITEADRAAFRQRVNLQPGQPVIGMAARLATEKGVEYLAQALPIILEKYPTARVLFLGQHQNVFGEEAYARRLAPLIERLGDHWMFLGVVPEQAKSAFFHECAVTVLPSLNSTDSFGLVQIESMLCGTPVVASDIPGIRQPVSITGMGRLAPPGDASALAQAILSILDNPELFRKNSSDIVRRFAPQTVAQEYEALFDELLR